MTGEAIPVCGQRVWPGGWDCQLAPGHPGQHFAQGVAAPVVNRVVTEATEVIRLNSVQIEDNSRGTTVTAKAYGATIHEAEDEAVTSIQRLRLRLQTISKRQAAAEQVVLALAKLLVAIDPVLEQVPDEAVREGYEALVSAGYQP